MQWGSDNARRTNILVPISDNGARLIFNQVRRIRADGGTRPIYAIDLNKKWAKYKVWESSNYGEMCAQNYIIFISDGHWMQPRPSTRKIKKYEKLSLIKVN